MDAVDRVEGASDSTITSFAPRQRAAAQAVYDYMKEHPETLVPASLITGVFVEAQDGRGCCLVGECAQNRAIQRANPHYEEHNDVNKKRIDHLYNHVRDKHFRNRPFPCPVKPMW